MGDNCRFLSFSNVKEVNIGNYGSGTDPIYIESNKDSLTFEVNSLGIWESSNIAVNLVEECPNVSQVFINSSNETSNGNSQMYFISFGEPNPSFREPDIYRKTRGNYYHVNTVNDVYSIDNDINGRINIYSSNNTVQLKDMVIDYENGNGPEIIYNFYGYQNQFNTTNFSMFKPGQIIRLLGNNASNLFRIDAIENDDDDPSIIATKLILEGINGTTVVDDSQDITGSGLTGIGITPQQTIIYDRIKWNSIQPDFVTDNTDADINNKELQAVVIQDGFIGVNHAARGTAGNNFFMTFDIGDITASEASNSSIHTTTVTMSRKRGTH